MIKAGIRDGSEDGAAEKLSASFGSLEGPEACEEPPAMRKL